MASKPKLMHGARAIMAVAGQVVGIFQSVNYQYALDVQVANILGRYTAAASEYTGVEPVQVSCTGWRVIDNGPFAVIGKNGERLVPRLQDIVSAEDITITIYDRQDPTKKILEVLQCKSQGVSGGYSARSLSEISVNFIGLAMTDENAPEQGEVGGTSLPTSD